MEFDTIIWIMKIPPPFEIHVFDFRYRIGSILIINNYYLHKKEKKNSKVTSVLGIFLDAMSLI